MPTHNKTGYEIRLEVLQMAMSLANERYHQVAYQLQFAAEKSNEKSFALPVDTRVADATAIAEQLYGFVEKK
jgi:hypothetical protein